MLVGRVYVLIVATITASCLPHTEALADPSPSPEGSVVCPPRRGPCTVEVERPGRDEVEEPAPVVEPVVSSGERTCRSSLVEEWTGDGTVPCEDPMFGGWDADEQCYFTLADPQPPPDDPVWEGHSDGAIYSFFCPGVLGTGAGLAWRPDAATGGPAASAVTPAVLAEEAIRLLPIRGPDIQMAPRPGSTGLVGLPVWMWTSVSAETWGPASATASVPGLSVTATAHAARIAWGMGDGTTVICDGPGTPYDPSYGNRMSPTCGHRYVRSSAREPGAAYTVTATTTWDVGWSGGGDSGALSVTRSSSTTVRIGEVQVLVQR
jgi:hypothetical protein